MGKFGWYVSGGFAAYAHLAGVRLDEAYTRPSACAEVFRVGRPRAKDLFGPEIQMGPPHCPPISYGHVVCLGAPLSFPEDSEPAVKPIFSSVREGIAALKRDVDFGRNSVFQTYWKTHEYLKSQFPAEQFGLSGFGMEGPVTTAVLLRGQEFYMDLYDAPGETKEFLGLVTDSVVKFIHFLRGVNQESAVNAAGSGMADDFASLIAPDLWPEFVVPFWNRYYEGITTGRRGVHVENLKPEHLRHFKTVGIRDFDPSVSPRLSPGVIKRELDVVFGWRMPSFELARMSTNEVIGWLHYYREDGADVMYTIVEKNTCLATNPGKIHGFMDTCRELAKSSDGK